MWPRALPRCRPCRVSHARNPIPRVRCASSSALRPQGAQDVLARLIGQWLSERLGQQFIVDNRPGGGGNIGAEAVVNAAADGYTLLLVGPPNLINATLYEKLNFNFIRDIAPSQDWCASHMSWKYTPRFQPERFPSSYRTRKPIPARSTWLLPASAQALTCPASSSR